MRGLALLRDSRRITRTRAELSALGEEVHGFQRDIDDAANRIKQVDRLVDQHTAASIQQADAALLTLTAHFSNDRSGRLAVCEQPFRETARLQNLPINPRLHDRRQRAPMRP